MEPDSLKKTYENFLLKPVMNEIVLREGRGLSLIDASGKDYMDFTSGFGVSLLGYNNEYTEYIKDAVQRQMSRIVHIPHYLYYSEPAIALAEKLAEILPGGLKKTFFCNSGSEAVEGAIGTVRRYKKRFELLASQQAFMGLTMGAVSLTGRSKEKKHIGPLLPGVHHVPAAYCFRCSLRQSYPDCNIACADYVEDLLEFDTSGDVAGAFIEPILGHAGVVVPPDAYFQKLLKICKRHDIAVVVDETLTGFGKTGKMFAIEHWGIQPEIVILGKAIGGGLPLGAFIVTDDVASAFEFEDFSSALGGNPVVCAGSLAMIDIIEKEALCEKAAKLGEYLINELQHIKATFDMVGEVRGKGLFVGIEIVEREHNAPAYQKADQVKRLMLEKGILITVYGYGRSTIRLTPPLIVEQEHIDRFVETLSSVLEEVSDVE